MTESHQLKQWTPPERFIQHKSSIPGVTVFGPKTESLNKDQIKIYACPNCAANIAYDVSAGGVSCDYCGYRAPVRSVNVGKASENFEFTLETMSQSTRGWGTKREILHCHSCGGGLSIPEGSVTTTCPFCASNKVNVTTSLDETLRPRFLIPFKVSLEKTKALAANWLGRGWFHPDELAANSIIHRFQGLYLPFWTFNTKINAGWRAQVGYERTERHYNAREKRWETRNKIVWRWEDGKVKLKIDDYLITGSFRKHISHQILKCLYPYQLSGLVAYDPDYLAGWRAQAYETTLTDAWESAKNEIREQAKKTCYQNISSSHVRNFSMTADFNGESWRYILLPVYLATYKHEDKTYQVMINGQTGSIAGQKPVAWWKIWLAIAALLSPGIILSIIGLPLLLVGGLGVIAITLGIILFVVGIIISFILYKNASQSEAK